MEPPPVKVGKKKEDSGSNPETLVAVILEATPGFFYEGPHQNKTFFPSVFSEGSCSLGV
ncbi:hypothetical protein DCCM_3097 [Desulfocucumis palustris]|uniref:Uncharacterized protein n=1 Tax=Desulfocucumis palustris TaxID=1898651 RepID=A0A2L2XIC7_9FIRM|nr:hypothetical protein DCCM_3097 [Desulfocucumis palustris]